MMKNKILEARRAKVSNEIRESVNLSFEIVDRIHSILQSKGMTQKHLSQKLNKSEAEISKWMHGTHNFTIDTIVKIENALGEKILKVTHEKPERSFIYFPASDYTSFKVGKSNTNVSISIQHKTQIYES